MTTEIDRILLLNTCCPWRMIRSYRLVICVFMITSGLSRIATAQKYTILKDFIDSEGASPCGSLVRSGNTLYGTTRRGCSNNLGAVFRINTDGTDFTIIKSFSAISNSPAAGNWDGWSPEAGVVLSGATLYGTTRSGGDWGKGTVFKLNTDGTGYSLLKAFPALVDNGSAQTNSDGASPYATVVLSGTALYGTTSEGGGSGNGVLFRIETNGTGYTVLKDFSATSYPYYTNRDGASPMAGLALLDGTLYGTTYGGGDFGHGTVFRLSTNGADFTVLRNFSSVARYPYTNSDGAQPLSGTTVSGTTLYGTTFTGGSSALGVVYKMNTDGTCYSVLKHFTQDDGGSPYAGVIVSRDTLYGAAYRGGIFLQGTVFKLNTNGTDYALLKHFDDPDGIYPQGGLTLCGRILYGTTDTGGGFGNGTVYSLDLGVALTIRRTGNEVVVSWPDDNFFLQAAPCVTANYTNIPSALSPYTNAAVGPEHYFRLRAN